MTPSTELLLEYIGYATVIATVIGTIIGAVISTLLSRSHKVTAFRQEWINSLREIFSEILLRCETFTDVAHQDNEESNREKLLLIKSISKAKLYLNLSENDPKHLIEILNKIPTRTINTPNRSDYYNSKKGNIESTMQAILKNEWNRVRDGEWMWKLKKALNSTKMFDDFTCSPLVLYILMLLLIISLPILAKCHFSQ